MEGRIELIIGPMFSGKTSELYRRVKLHVMANEECLVLKYIKDTRYCSSRASLAASHDGAFMRAISVASPWEVDQELLERAAVIAIDEGQFMPRLAQFCNEQADKGKIVLVSGLDSTFGKAPFEEIVALIPLSERIDKLQAICFGCHRPASFSRRINENVHCLEDIGGPEKYVASCRDCFTVPISPHHLERNRGNAERLKLLQSI